MNTVIKTLNNVRTGDSGVLADLFEQPFYLTTAKYRHSSIT